MERKQDERWNRMASLLLALSMAAMTSPVCEKKALFALCQVIQEKNVDTALVSKVCSRARGTFHQAPPCFFKPHRLDLLFVCLWWSWKWCSTVQRTERQMMLFEIKMADVIGLCEDKCFWKHNDLWRRELSGRLYKVAGARNNAYNNRNLFLILPSAGSVLNLRVV